MSNRLLIIDDDAGCRTQLGAFFEDSGWSVSTAASGEAGIEHLGQVLPDALIVDLDMPGMRGTEVIAWVVARYPHLPTIVVSGTTDMRDLVEATHRGAWDFFLKPVENPAALEKTVRNCCERARLQRANESYRQHLEDILARDFVVLENGIVGIVSIDQAGRIKWRNEMAMTLTALPLYAGEPFLSQFPEIADTWPAVSARLVTGEAFRTECSCQSVNLDGTSRQIRLQLAGQAVVQGGELTESVWIISDVSERYAAEAQMKLAMQRQAELSALRSRFVSMTSHEFRSPLTLLKSSLELLRDYGARFDEAQRADLFDRMTRAIGRMQDMLDGLMQLGKTELLREKFSPVRCNAVELIGQQAHQAAMTFNVAALGRLRVLNETEDPWCELDAAVMEHILGNLISNALKYSPDGTPVCIRIFGDAATLSLTVEDQGIGIPPDDLPLLFGDFQRAANVRHLPGAGMGLAIVRQMVTLQGGSVDVDSPISADGGCRFTVCVPRRAARGNTSL